MNIFLHLDGGGLGGTTIGTVGSVVSGLDRGHRTTGTAGFALHKIKTGEGVAGEGGFGVLAHVACDVLDDIFLKERFNVLWRVAAAQDQALVAVQGAFRTQLGEDKGLCVSLLTVHDLTDLGEVGPHGFTGTCGHKDGIQCM